jgi:hypothetical protein
VRAHRDSGNGGPAGRCARAGRVELPFIGAGEGEGLCGCCLEGRAREFKARHTTADAHRTLSVGGAAGSPARAHAGGHTQV